MYKNLLKFLKNNSGNVAMTLGIVALPLIAAAGVAVDYSRTYQTQSRIQQAADTAALAAAMQAEKSDAERYKIALDMFQANYPDISPSDFKVNINGDSVEVIPTIDLKMFFLGVVGTDVTPVTVRAVANSTLSEIEIALVLDVSGSMRHQLAGGESRLKVLKDSAHLLLDKMEKLSSAKLSISIVPFTMNVNIGKHNTNMVDIKQFTKMDGSKGNYFEGTEWMGCVFERSDGNYVSDNPGKKLIAYNYPPLPDGTAGGYCKKNVSDGTNEAYANLTEPNGGSSLSAQYDGPNRNCVRHAISPLSTNIADARSKIDSLTAEPNDGTIIGPGVTWGLRALSPAWPFKEGSKWRESTDKIMIVLTDGEQTTEAEYQQSSCNKAENSKGNFRFNPDKYGLTGDVIKKYGPKDNMSPYGFIYDSDPFGTNPQSWSDVRRDLENISLAACTEAKRPHKGKQIDLYTVGVSDDTAPGSGVYNLLNKCASSPDKHYFAPTASALENAFDDIATRISKLRLTH